MFDDDAGGGGDDDDDDDPRCVCTNKVGYKEVKNTTSFGMSKVVLIKQHVSAYSEAIFRFYKWRLNII
jgi:hypothetical protein